jgi:AcrR family transcriptional regulator
MDTIPSIRSCIPLHFSMRLPDRPPARRDTFMKQFSPIFRRPSVNDLLALAKQRFLEDKFESIEQLSAELGISRSVAYKWVGNSEQLLSLVIAQITEDSFNEVCSQVKSKGAKRVIDVLMQISHKVAAQKAHRRLVEKNPEKFLRMIASKAAPIQSKSIQLTQALLEEEQSRGRLQLPFDAHTLAYVLVRVCESFLYAETIANEPMDFEKEELALKALLGIRSKSASSQFAKVRRNGRATANARSPAAERKRTLRK